MNAADNWLEVDRKGLAKLLERRSPEWIVYELIQNAWDTQATTVEVSLQRDGRFVRLEVKDDDPNGFADLSHAFTLYAESTKKGNAELRGRFNCGDKVVLARCTWAELTSTKGTLRFDEKGRHRLRRKSLTGSSFVAVMKMSADEYAACLAGVRRLIPPQGVTTIFNGEPLPKRNPIDTFTATLPTEVADDDGVLRRTARKTTVTAYEPLPGEVPALYELGIPVVETSDRWHVDIGQRVPLNVDRDNVTPAYLAKVRALVLEYMAPLLDAEQANATWVRNAIQEHGNELSDSVVSKILDLRFTEKRVAHDVSDPESNARAVAAGYTVVHGSQMSRAEWDAARRTGTILPAGRVTPSPKPFSPDGRPLQYIEEDAMSPAMRAFRDYAERIGHRLLQRLVTCWLTKDTTWQFAGAYSTGRLIINWRDVRRPWEAGELILINDLLLHEFAHHFEESHLSDDFHRALSRLGAKLTQLALDEPTLFNLPSTEAA